jgi:hypothetical protein
VKDVNNVGKHAVGGHPERQVDRDIPLRSTVSGRLTYLAIIRSEKTSAPDRLAKVGKYATVPHSSPYSGCRVIWPSTSTR